MRFPLFLALALSPAPILASLNAYEILMFFDMYRADYEKSSTDVKIAKACKDCNFEEFVLHIDRLNLIGSVEGRIADQMNPEIDEVEGWETRDSLVYDARKLLGGLWRDEDNGSRPGHPTVIERLVDRVSQLRDGGSSDPARLGKITTAMEYAHFSRRSAQAKEMLTFINGRLSKQRLGAAKTQTIDFIGGAFDEFDSVATIESVQKTKRGAMRNEIVAIAKDINSGNVDTSSSSSKKRGIEVGNLQKRAFGDGMAVMSLQRGMDTLKMPSRKKC